MMLVEDRPGLPGHLILVRCDCGWLGSASIFAIGNVVGCLGCGRSSRIVRTREDSGVLAMIETFASQTLDMVSTAEECIAKRRPRPALVLLYSAIEASAWLERPDGQADTYGSDFANWCDRFLLPNSSIPCTAAELYSSRCAVIHTPGADSRSVRERGARMVFFSNDPANEGDTLKQAASLGLSGVFISFGCLIEGLWSATTKFQYHLTGNTGRHGTYFDRLNLSCDMQYALSAVIVPGEFTITSRIVIPVRTSPATSPK